MRQPGLIPNILSGPLSLPEVTQVCPKKPKLNTNNSKGMQVLELPANLRSIDSKWTPHRSYRHHTSHTEHI